jgi:hypothetical protein
LPGCAADPEQDVTERVPLGEEGSQTDDGNGEEVGTSTSALSTRCPHGGQRFVFDGGKEIVCRRRTGAATSYYDFMNNTGKAWNKMIALDNSGDTHCQRVGARRWYTWHKQHLPGAGKPQHVRGC